MCARFAASDLSGELGEGRTPCGRRQTSQHPTALLCDRNYPQTYPHRGGTRWYEAALSHHRAVVIRIHGVTPRHATPRQSALLKTARAAKPSGVRIPSPSAKVSVFGPWRQLIQINTGQI
jgi:hypothetical protein